MVKAEFFDQVFHFVVVALQDAKSGRVRGKTNFSSTTLCETDYLVCFYVDAISANEDTALDGNLSKGCWESVKLKSAGLIADGFHDHRST